LKPNGYFRSFPHHTVKVTLPSARAVQSTASSTSPPSGSILSDLLPFSCLAAFYTGIGFAIASATMTPQRCTARPSGVSLPKAKCVRTWKTFFRNHAQAIAGAVATWPLAAGAQQAAMPVIGFLRSVQLVDATHLVTAFSQGLNDRHLCSCGLGGAAAMKGTTATSLTSSVNASTFGHPMAPRRPAASLTDGADAAGLPRGEEEQISGLARYGALSTLLSRATRRVRSRRAGPRAPVTTCRRATTAIP
jgi:hypothetical protein